MTVSVGPLTFSSFSLTSFKGFLTLCRHNLCKTISRSSCISRANRRYIHLSKSKQKAGRVVLISTSDVIFDNLALEEWLYENKDLSSTEYLFMWKNKPAIVSGRHQNPWLEANIPLAASLDLDIARRYVDVEIFQRLSLLLGR